MALGWNTIHALPRLRTYADASEREASTKPIRGDKEERKPLAQRNMKWRHIRKEADGTITVHEGYAHPLLRFYPDDTVSVHPSAYTNKATGHDMIRRVLGIDVWTEAGDSWVKCRGGTFKLRAAPRSKWLSDEHKWAHVELAPEHDNRLKWEPTTGKWVFLNPPMLIKHVVNRSGAKAVRERYAGFSLYLSAMAKLRRDNKPEFDEYVEVFGTANNYSATQYSYKPWWMLKVMQVSAVGFNHNHAATLCQLMASDQPEDQYKAYLWLVLRASTAHLPAAIKAMDKCLMMTHHDEMLQTKPAEPGDKAIDRYRWAVPKQG